MRLAEQGDIFSPTSNFLRDTLFNGNQELYHAFRNDVSTATMIANLTLISVPSASTRPLAEPINVNNVVNNPQLITNKPPQHWYNLFKNKGFNPQPLSRGSLQGIPFENGGGFKITWGGDKILQFHPTGAHHDGIGYWKISSGSTGTIRFDLNGNIISN